MVNNLLITDSARGKILDLGGRQEFLYSVRIIYHRDRDRDEKLVSRDVVDG